MVRETLGDQIDIHGGGADLIFPHHENEIAQSESLTGCVPFARHWAHAGLVTLAGGDKMAHSAENFTTLATILERYTPMEVRYFLLATHYRSSLTFSLESANGAADGWAVRGSEDARGALGRLRRALGEEPLVQDGPLDQASLDRFIAAMDADFNTPDALAAIFDLAREINTARAASMDRAELDRKRRTLVHLLDVLGLDLRLDTPGDRRIDPYLDLLVEVRRKLRDSKQYQLADEIRTRLADLGVTVEDRPGGESTWRLGG
jgi:cysteinyl-tRNA synthetase